MMASDGDSPRSAGDDAASENESRDSADPRTVRVVAVTADDVLTALEANERRDRGAVLRVTPPFAGRMRARLHVAGGEGEYDGEATPLHVDPEDFVGDCPSFPTVDDTADELRSSDEPYTPERHESRHVEAVERWRSAVRDALAETVTVSGEGDDDEPHEIDVRYLG